MSSPNLAPQQIKQIAAELAQPETMDKIIEATRAVLGEDVPNPIIGAALQNAAGYIYAIETGKCAPSQTFTMASVAGLHFGASIAPCQCQNCTSNRKAAKASADAVLRKAAGR